MLVSLSNSYVEILMFTVMVLKGEGTLGDNWVRRAESCEDANFLDSEESPHPTMRAP